MEHTRAFILSAVIPAAVLLLLSANFYLGMRGLWEQFGFSVSAAAKNCLLLLIFLVPIAVISAVAHAAAFSALEVTRPNRRLQRGLCPWCGYSMVGLRTHAEREGGEQRENPAKCPECGRPPESRATVRDIQGRSLSLSASLTAAALLAGATLGEAWALLDEAAFVSEVTQLQAAGTPVVHTRSRWWPSDSCQLYYVPGRGFGATE